MATLPSSRKRIIVCCDGTWMDSDGEYQTPSNVTRIARAIKPVGKDDQGNAIPQIIFYQNGVGTGTNSLYVKYVGGATGEGLANNIREAYAFICQNYVAGDEIFLIGFSRGAFTARSISSLIRAIGLLTSKGQEHFSSIFEDWQYQLKPGYKTRYPNYPWPGHAPPVNAPDYQRKLLELELTRPNIPIKAVAVWDTVGGLGIPMIGLLPQPPSTDFAFVDTKVEMNIEYAFQALALDEHRRAYHPTVWEKPAGQKLPRILKQTWFPGVHSDVGGSYADTDLANLTLCWMVSQLSPFLDFEYNYIWTQVRLGIEKHTRLQIPAVSTSTSTHQTQSPIPITPTHLPTAIRPWGLGKIHNSMTFFFRLGGSKTRTPGEYRVSERASQHGTLWFIGEKLATGFLHRLGFFNEKPMPRLQNTHETFHSSVRIRMGMKGKGYDDKGTYESQALQGWAMYGELADPDTPWQAERPGMAGKMKRVRWRKVVDEDDEQQEEDANKNGQLKLNAAGQAAQHGEEQPRSSPEVLEIAEDEMGDFEKKILQLWPEISDDFDLITPGGQRQEVIDRKRRSKTFPTAPAPPPPPPPRQPGVPSDATGPSNLDGNGSTVHRHHHHVNGPGHQSPPTAANGASPQHRLPTQQANGDQLPSRKLGGLPSIMTQSKERELSPPGRAGTT